MTPYVLLNKKGKTTGGTVIEDEEEEITGKATTALWGYAFLPSKHRALEYRKTENVSKFRINFFSYHLIVSVETKHETRFQRCNFVSHLLMEFSRSFSLWFAF